MRFDLLDEIQLLIIVTWGESPDCQITCVNHCVIALVIVSI